ncbi:MAG: hypothetical protein H6832_15830 [Planctomycetes bacterium]|nr:hypothetical protein [Planctomycetota bacterium]MCB9891867.1 hypothetical protein [Planctomycetota bacterium]MCB9919872.1 hypothetical protein [Planctomycetota bacterium]
MRTRESIVAWYGQKAPDFGKWIAGVQAQCARCLGDLFVPYEPERVHATLFDVSTKDGLCVAYRELRGTSVVADVPAVEAWLAREIARNPLRIHFGGDRTDDRRLTSRGVIRRDRRFSIQGDKVVVLGWSEKHGALSDLRKGAEAFGLLHRYHAIPSDVDDDCYMRIGLLEPTRSRGSAIDVHDVDRLVHTHLDHHDVTVDLQQDDVRVVTYMEESLPLATTSSRQLDGA